jgi:hypothetical protein
MDGREMFYYDITQAILCYKSGNLRLNFGRGEQKWGPGLSGNLLISDHPPAYDFLSARYDFSNLFRLVYFTGALHPYPETYQEIDTTPQGNERRIVDQKFIAAHRLEIYPLKGVEIGLNEAVIYGERGLEPAYLNPINLYFSAQHNLGDMDNLAWSGDIELNLIRKLSLYGELFIDDMRTAKLGTDYHGNKFGYIAGFHTADPFLLLNTDITCEYIRLDPFLYSHQYAVNTYKNWNSCLGYPLPPNSDRLYLNLKWHPHYCWTGSLSASFTRHGDNIITSTDTVNVGGDIDLSYEPDQTTAPFLDGQRLDITLWEAGVRWEPLEYYFWEGRYRWHRWSGGVQNEWYVSFGVKVW